MASLHVPAFQVHAYPRLPKLAALQQVRTLLDACGAHLLDSRLYSDKMIVVRVGLPLADWERLAAALINSDLHADAPVIPAALAGRADADGDIWGTIELTLPDGGPETADIIPAVPG